MNRRQVVLHAGITNSLLLALLIPCSLFAQATMNQNSIRSLRVSSLSPDGTEAVLSMEYHYNGTDGPIAQILPTLEKKGQKEIANWFRSAAVSVAPGQGVVTAKITFLKGDRGVPSDCETDQVVVRMYNESGRIILAVFFFRLPIAWGRMDAGTERDSGEDAFHRVPDSSGPPGGESKIRDPAQPVPASAQQGSIAAANSGKPEADSQAGSEETRARGPKKKSFLAALGAKFRSAFSNSNIEPSPGRRSVAPQTRGVARLSPDVRRDGPKSADDRDISVPKEPARRSAGFQPAVSPIWSRRDVGSSAGYKPAIPQPTSLRHEDAVQLNAPVPDQRNLEASQEPLSRSRRANEAVLKKSEIRNQKSEMGVRLLTSAATVNDSKGRPNDAETTVQQPTANAEAPVEESARLELQNQPGVIFSALPSNQLSPWQERLTLGPGDVLNLSLFGEPDTMKTDVFILPDGRVSFLEAQNVLAAGSTVDELRAKLDEALAKYRRAPHTMISPVAYRSKRFFMLGKIARAGVFTLDQPLTILQAVARAGGLATGLTGGSVVDAADLSRSFLIRQGKRSSIDLEKLFQQGDLSQNLPIEPDDYLYFAANNLREIYVLGAVNNPGPVAFLPDITAVGAIAGGGGFTEQAWKRRILVVRGSLNAPETFVVNAASVLSAKSPDLKLQPKDIVYVSQRPWIKAEELLDSATQAFVQAAVVVWTGVKVTPINP
ncbi:MAG: polysaccharide biosynthesis/export family protein [Verrucomicrobia bacterium]|nr:polysaccharide biosynthesis/export family protein [Verrucomicrobiota bacterium]